MQGAGRTRTRRGRRWWRASTSCSGQSNAVGSVIVTELTAYDAPKSISIQLFGIFSGFLAYDAVNSRSRYRVNKLKDTPRNSLILKRDYR